MMLVREGIKADSQSEEIDFLSKLPLRSINQKPFIVLHKRHMLGASLDG